MNSLTTTITIDEMIVVGNNAWNPNANAFIVGFNVKSNSDITPTTTAAIAPCAVAFFQ